MDNVGLSTPRGSGTSGYVQRNLAHITPRNQPIYNPDAEIKEHRPREPNREILQHERKREVESKVFDLRDKLEDEGLDEDEIDRRCDTLRTQLLAKLSNARPNRGLRRDFKSHQVHEMADAKQRESERMRCALHLGRGIGGPSGGGNGPIHGGSSLNPANRRNVEKEKTSREGPRRDVRGKYREERRYRDLDEPRGNRRSMSPVEREREREREREKEREYSRSRSRPRPPARSPVPVRDTKGKGRSFARSVSRSRSRSRSFSRSRSPVRRVPDSRSVSRSRSRSRSISP